jgi:hypothetical protein
MAPAICARGQQAAHAARQPHARDVTAPGPSSRSVSTSSSWPRRFHCRALPCIPVQRVQHFAMNASGGFRRQDITIYRPRLVGRGLYAGSSAAGTSAAGTGSPMAPRSALAEAARSRRMHRAASAASASETSVSTCSGGAPARPSERKMREVTIYICRGYL